MATVGNLWVFGDSFSYNFEFRKTHPYFKFKKEGDSSYVDHFAKTYNLKIQNKATPGWGNFNILHDLLYYSSEIKPEDFLIVGTSESTRTQSFEYQHNLTRCYQASFGYSFDEFDRNKSQLEVDPAFATSMEQYILNCKFPLLKYQTSFELTMIQNVFKLIKARKKVLWSSNLWGKFESITQDTKGEIEDGHWSFNGHKDFFTFLKQSLVNQDIFIDPSYTTQIEEGKYYLDPLDFERE